MLGLARPTVPPPPSRSQRKSSVQLHRHCHSTISTEGIKFLHPGGNPVKVDIALLHRSNGGPLPENVPMQECYRGAMILELECFAASRNVLAVNTGASFRSFSIMWKLEIHYVSQ